MQSPSDCTDGNQLRCHNCGCGTTAKELTLELRLTRLRVLDITLWKPYHPYHFRRSSSAPVTRVNTRGLWFDLWCLALFDGVVYFENNFPGHILYNILDLIFLTENGTRENLFADLFSLCTSWFVDKKFMAFQNKVRRRCWGLKSNRTDKCVRMCSAA